MRRAEGAPVAYPRPMLAALVVLAQLQPLPKNLVPLDSDAGRALFAEAESQRPYFRLSSQFLTQKTTTYCGVAASVMVLNALPLEAPVAKEWAPFRAFTQDNVFDASASLGITAEHVASGGLTLDQLAALLLANHAEPRALHAADATVDAFRTDASQALRSPEAYVLVDFLRSGLGQDTGAHWSPLAAYDAKADRFLVLDVARFRYPPYWATTADLWTAMSTNDPDSGKTRGYVIVRPSAGAPGRAPVAPVGHRIIWMASLVVAAIFAAGAVTGALIMRWRWKPAPRVA